MESGNQWVLYEKLIKLSKNFNKHLKKTAKEQKIKKQEIIKNNEEFLKLITQQEIIIKKQSEKILKQKEEIKLLKEISKSSMKYIESVTNLIDNKTPREEN